MLVYLDVCCFNRPFDDQSQIEVRLQTEAKLHIQFAIRNTRVNLCWSAMIDLENARNPDPDRRRWVAGWKSIAGVDVDSTPDVERLAKQITAAGIKPFDALHVASAITGGASWFISTDKQLLRKLKQERRIRSGDPLDFIRELEESNVPQ